MVLLMFTFFSTAGFAQQAAGGDGAGLSLLATMRTALEKNPDIMLKESQILSSEGQLFSAQSQFDPSLQLSLEQDRSDQPELVDDLDQIYNTTTSLSLGKKFGNGMSAGFGADVQRIETVSISPYIGNTPYNLNQADVYMVVNVPLLRGRGFDANGAYVTAADTEYEISKLTYFYAVNENLVTIAGAYYDYLAAKESLDIIKASEARAESNMEETQALIDADELPRARISLFKADHADRTSSRLRYEQVLRSSQHDLGLKLGVDIDEIDTLPLPSEDFIDLSSDDIGNIIAHTQAVVDMALRHRPDYIALSKSRDVSEIMLKMAKNSLLHKLDVQMKAGYTGAADGDDFKGYYSAFSQDIPGANATLTFNYELPFKNRSARGDFLKRRSAIEQATIQLDEFTRSIQSSVMLAISNLESLYNRKVLSENNLRLYEEVLENERIKFRRGMATQFDVINATDKMLNAQINHVQLLSDVSKAVVSFRFITGTLIAAEGTTFTIDIQRFTTLPDIQ